jgi:hypothetical protein
VIDGFVEVDIELELCSDNLIKRFKAGIFDDFRPLVKTFAWYQGRTTSANRVSSNQISFDVHVVEKAIVSPGFEGYVL